MKSKYSIKKWFQFRLRTFVIVVFVTGLFFGWLANENAKREHEVAAINKLVTTNPKASYQVIRSASAKPGLKSAFPVLM